MQIEELERLHDLCLDWDNSPMPDGAETRVPITCGQVRNIIAMARERDSYKAALEPFAKSGELLARIGDAGDFWAYRPAGGDEYGITGRHLLDAYTALERRGSE